MHICVWHIRDILTNLKESNCKPTFPQEKQRMGIIIVFLRDENVRRRRKYLANAIERRKQWERYKFFSLISAEARCLGVAATCLRCSRRTAFLLLIGCRLRFLLHADSNRLMLIELIENQILS